MTWRAYGEPRMLPLGASVRYLRSSGSPQGGHLVRLRDGRTVRVLPDGDTTGQKRSRTISEALTELESGQFDPLAYLTARLVGIGAVVEPADGSEETGEGVPV